ncbi:unnamed protein product [Acanthosepion pharaonis]|uniref:Uncharacterized protein n=1 Tax=Acanthosepion pharaonis TaxID=158019 RepID=A0A812D704_ACAPH|nr:unnamed protein product [Sepia pharaonis]
MSQQTNRQDAPIGSQLCSGTVFLRILVKIIFSFLSLLLSLSIPPLSLPISIPLSCTPPSPSLHLSFCTLIYDSLNLCYLSLLSLSRLLFNICFLPLSLHPCFLCVCVSLQAVLCFPLSHFLSSPSFCMCVSLSLSLCPCFVCVCRSLLPSAPLSVSFAQYFLSLLSQDFYILHFSNLKFCCSPSFSLSLSLFYLLYCSLHSHFMSLFFFL